MKSLHWVSLITLVTFSGCGSTPSKSFEARATPYVNCPDDEIEEFVEVAVGKQVVRCKQNIPPGINEVLNAEYQERAEARAEAREQAAQSSGTGSSRPAGCDTAELASLIIADYRFGNYRPYSELDAALKAIAYFLEQNNFRYEARAIDNASSLDDAYSVYSGLIPQICSG